MTALYREANVVPELLAALDRLDYPRDRLEVLLIVEEDDDETQAACRAHARDGWKVVVVPDGHPRTKPRALNYALDNEAGGELFTIYDAEDRPEPGQLIAAAGAFAALPATTVALQARLDFYNEQRQRAHALVHLRVRHPLRPLPRGRRGVRSPGPARRNVDALPHGCGA